MSDIVERLRAELQNCRNKLKASGRAKLRAERDALLEALRKVRGHTSFAYANTELLVGLLRNIERIADAALAAKEEA